MGRKKITVKGIYSCGCAFGPIWIQERPKYCKLHGDNVLEEYDADNGSSRIAQEEIKPIQKSDEDKPRFEGQLFQDVTDSPIEKIILSGVKHYKNKFGVVMKYVLVHKEAMKENEIIIKDKDYGDIIVRKDGHLGRTYYWFFSEQPPEKDK